MYRLDFNSIMITIPNSFKFEDLSGTLVVVH